MLIIFIQFQVNWWKCRRFFFLFWLVYRWWRRAALIFLHWTGGSLVRGLVWPNCGKQRTKQNIEFWLGGEAGLNPPPQRRMNMWQCCFISFMGGHWFVTGLVSVLSLQKESVCLFSVYAGASKLQNAMKGFKNTLQNKHFMQRTMVIMV